MVVAFNPENQSVLCGEREEKKKKNISVSSGLGFV